MIYKLLATSEWSAAKETGVYEGSALDRSDGFIHFSSADQVVETAVRYFAGQRDLTLLAVDPAPLGADLRWEPSREGALFPHLYAVLPAAMVTRETALDESLPVGEAVAAALTR